MNSIVPFHTFLRLVESEADVDRVWLVFWPESETAGEPVVELHFTEEDARIAYNEMMIGHTNIARESFVQLMLDQHYEHGDPGEFDDKEDDQLRADYEDAFDNNEDPEEWGEPPEIIGPIVAGEPSEESHDALRVCVALGRPDIAEDLIKMGADPERVFANAEEILSFFDGDIDWMPDGDLKRKLQLMKRSKKMFGFNS